MKAIPESLGNPDETYEAAISLDELSSPEQYMMHNGPNGYGSNGGKTNNGGNRWPKIPKFMSALSPSKVKISDLLRPLLRKVRPGPLPPSPGKQLHGSPAPGGYGGSKGSNVPMIPAGTPYSNSGHRPENLDVIHLIAGPAANSYQPAVIHVSQLVRHKNRGPMSNGKKKKMRNKKKSGINNQGFNPYPGFEGAAAPPMMPFAQYQSSLYGGNGNPFPQGLNPYPSSAPGMRPSAPASGPNYGQQSGIKGGGGGMTKYQVINGNHQESYEINHGSPHQPQSNSYNTQPQVMTGYSGPSTGNNNYEEMISISMPPNPPHPSYGQSYSELANMPPAPFQHVNQRPQPSHQSSSSQSYGPSGNQKEYIEVINLPPRGQSVEYNPGPTPSSNNYNSGYHGNGNQQSASYQNSQSQGSQQSGYNQGSHGQSYSTASSLPSSGYGDQSSNNNPSYESNHNSAPSPPPSSYGSGGHGGGSGATIELIDGSTSPNFNYKGVTSLDPKELVELIAKQVPSLKDVLTPGHSNSDQGSSGYGNGNSNNKESSSNYQSQNSGPDVSYEVIQMPPIYHNKDNNAPQEQPEPSYSPAVNYAGKGQESGEVSYEGGNGQGGDGGNGNYQSSGYTRNQESSYAPQSSQSSTSSESQSSYQPPYESPSTYDQEQQQQHHNLRSPSVQYSSSNSQMNYEPQGNNNNYINSNNYDSNSNNQYLPDESQRSNVIASQGTSSVQLPSSSSPSSSTSQHSSSSAPSSSYKFGQRLTSTHELSSSSSAEETLSQPSSSPSSSSSSSGSSSSQSSGSESVLSQLYSTSKDGGRVKVSPVKVLTKESEEDDFKEDSNLAGLLLSESSLPLPSESGSESDETVAKSRK